MAGVYRARLVTGGWSVAHPAGTPQELHDLNPGANPGRLIWVMEPSRSALVLGSTQSGDVVVDASSVDVARRRSGGGAVLVEPTHTLWIDVIVPSGDPLWSDDVSAAAHWLGQTWADVIGGAAVVHRGPMVRAAWSSLLCVAGTGPGEVVDGERKIVGISQRRTRAWARFQCVAYAEHDHELVARSVGHPELSGLLEARIGLLQRSPADTAAAFIEHLP